MALNVQLERGKNENNLSLLKRFNRRVQEAGVIQKVKSMRFSTRIKSKNVQKKNKLALIEKIEKREELYKLGKPLSQLKRRK